MTIEEIERILASRPARQEPVENRRQAAVAMILREKEAAVEMLFIERAHHDGDPWSGDLGFPGGKIEPDDDGTENAAKRETREEIGLDLCLARRLGRLDDICGAHLPVVVSCFVYAMTFDKPLQLNHEVSAAYWIPLERLFAPERHVSTTVVFRNEPLVRPAIDLLGPGRTVLWGITYRLVRQLRKRLELVKETTS